MRPPDLTISGLVRDLRERGRVAPGQALIVHSSLRAVGRVPDGPIAVVHALRQALDAPAPITPGDPAEQTQVSTHASPARSPGVRDACDAEPRGTLLMPTFNDPPADGRFDLRTAPSQTGAITEAFRTSPGVRRSRHPTHSVAAWGPLRDALLAGHERTSGLGVGSPLHKAALAGADVLLIGCDLTRCSVVHVAEAIAQVPYLGRAWYPGYDHTLTLIDELGREHAVPPRDPPGDSSQFHKVQSLLDDRRQLHRCTLGHADCLRFRATDALAAALDLLADDPLAFLCENPRCAYCTLARSACAIESI